MSFEDQTDPTVEEPEGLQDPETIGDYPLDELLIRQETRTVQGALQRIAEGRYIMDPDFQRGFVWKPDKQSRLVESVLMRIPLPVFYLAENREGKMIVVDGLQRMTTLHRFREDKFKLHLPDNKTLNGKTFSALEPKHQNRFEDVNLIFYIIDPKVPDRARLDIFERVNGGVALSRQQMRNALYSGPATRLLKAEAESNAFLKATGRSLNTKTMRDREFVNRFCSFHLLGVDAYEGDMDQFHAAGLEQMNAMASSELKALSKAFQASLANNYNVFGEHAFRRSIGGSSNRRAVLNAALWDVLSTELAWHAVSSVTARSKDIKKAVIGLLKNEEFERAITLGTGGGKQVRTRFEMAKAALQEVCSC